MSINWTSKIRTISFGFQMLFKIRTIWQPNLTCLVWNLYVPISHVCCKYLKYVCLKSILLCLKNKISVQILDKSEIRSKYLKEKIVWKPKFGSDFRQISEIWIVSKPNSYWMSEIHTSLYFRHLLLIVSSHIHQNLIVVS